MHGEPAVLYIDAARARRHGVRFARNRRNGLWMAERIPAHDILNLQSGFDQQLSAGGFPVRIGPDGLPQLALVRVSRRNGATWEVAKGKLELGEPPELAAIREVREEMGLASDLRITRSLGTIRYGFLAPGGLPRLKIVYLYLMAPVGPMTEFAPRSQEGISDVRWFGLDEAQDAITHVSLRPAVRLARDVLAA
jgi:8-oxo-dGTP pyrophosphatase MutT (NUDIX family)